MAIYILNKQDGSQSIDEFENVPSETILWKGSKSEFEKLNIKDSEIGGLELKGRKLVFNQDKWNEAQKQKLPIATGKGLIQFIEDAKSSLTWTETTELLEKLSGLFLIMKQSRANPLPLVNLDEEIQKLAVVLTPKENAIINGIATQWKKTVRFI